MKGGPQSHTLTEQDEFDLYRTGRGLFGHSGRWCTHVENGVRWERKVAPI